MAKKSAKKKERKTIKKEEAEEKTIKEEVCEIFDVEKDGKEKTIKSCGIEEQKAVSTGQVKSENKTFKTIIVLMIGIALLFLATYWIIESAKHFEVEGVKFDIVKEGDLILYRTSLPVMYQGKPADYNFYLRKDPRVLNNIEFNGDDVNLKQNMVINMTQDFHCDGDGIIAVANLLKLYEVLGIDVIKDENATCDDIYGRYIFLRIKEGVETEMDEFGFSGGCYNVYIKDCEILEGVEKFMLETFIEANKKLKQ